MSYPISNTLVILGAGVTAVGGSLLLNRWLCSYRFVSNSRLKELGHPGNNPTAYSVFKDSTRMQVNRSDFTSRFIITRLQEMLDRASIQCPAWKFLLMSLFVSLVAGGFGYCASVFVALLFAVCGLVAPLFALIARRNTQTRKLARQLPEAYRVISRVIRSGQTVTAALKMIADDFPAPVATYFAECYEQQERGIGKESALRQMAERSGVLEMRIFVVAVLIQSKSGGDLVEVLDNLSAMVEKRLRLKNRIRAMTAEGRMQAIVLIALPTLTFATVYYLTPDYAQVLMQYPALLLSTATMQLLGAAWIYRIVNFEY